MEDMQLPDLETAYQTMLDSSEFGARFHVLEDQAEDVIWNNLPYRSCI
jgi:hypothetical protein